MYTELSNKSQLSDTCSNMMALRVPSFLGCYASVKHDGPSRFLQAVFGFHKDQVSPSNYVKDSQVS
jgi:hypothetical protein